MSHTCHNPSHGEDPAACTGATWRLWIELSVFLVAGAFFTFSFFAGRIDRFVASYYAFLSPVAAAILFGMLVFRWLSRNAGAHDAACEVCSAAWEVPKPVAACILLAPMVVVLALNPTALSRDGARKRRAPLARARNPKLERAMKWAMGEKTERKAAAQGGSVPANPTVKELLEMADKGQAAAMKGKFVTVIGQCDTGSAGAKGFDLYRLVVTCCIADSLTVAVPVVRKDDVPLEPGGWVRVSGIIQFDSDAGEAVPVIHAAAPIAKIPEPPEPYL